MKQKIILITFILVVTFSVNAYAGTVLAASSNNPIFATIERVQQMISDALSPITATLTNHEERIASLEENLTATPVPTVSTPGTVQPKSIEVLDGFLTDSFTTNSIDVAPYTTMVLTVKWTTPYMVDYHRWFSLYYSDDLSSWSK